MFYFHLLATPISLLLYAKDLWRLFFIELLRLYSLHGAIICFHIHTIFHQDVKFNSQNYFVNMCTVLKLSLFYFYFIQCEGNKQCHRSFFSLVLFKSLVDNFFTSFTCLNYTHRIYY